MQEIKSAELLEFRQLLIGLQTIAETDSVFILFSTFI